MLKPRAIINWVALTGAFTSFFMFFQPVIQPVIADALVSESIPPCGADRCYYQWQVKTVESLAGYKIGNWRDCVTFQASPYTQDITCSISHSTSNTATATLTGSWPAGPGSISSAVGYNVTQTTTVTVSDTVSVPAGGSGTVQWAPRYFDLKKVWQNDSYCEQDVRTGTTTCYRTTDWAIAYTEKYDDPDYRVVRL